MTVCTVSIYITYLYFRYISTSFSFVSLLDFCSHSPSKQKKKNEYLYKRYWSPYALTAQYTLSPTLDLVYGWQERKLGGGLRVSRRIMGVITKFCVVMSCCRGPLLFLSLPLLSRGKWSIPFRRYIYTHIISIFKQRHACTHHHYRHHHHHQKRNNIIIILSLCESV